MKRLLRSRASGILLTAITLALTELAAHGPFGPLGLVSATLLLSALAAVAFAAFTGGIRGGLACALILGVYTLHFVSPHRAIVSMTPETWQGGGIMLVLGATVSLVVGGLKRRADRLAERALDAEREHAAAVEKANAELRRVNEALEAFSYLVSHDLKEPVRTTEMLLGFLESDHGKALDADGRDLLRRARNANDRLSRLLASLLDLSRASRIAPADVAPVSVARALEDEGAVVRYHELMRERGARVEVDLDGAPPVFATVPAITQIFGNLVANAIRHNQGPRPLVTLRLEASSSPDTAAFLIEDNGAGFPEGLVQHFADVRAMPSSTRDGGFGLIIARRATERLGGRLTLLPAPSSLGGAAVRVELPAARPARP